MYVQKGQLKKFYTDIQIQKMLNLAHGCVNKITGSVYVTYQDRETLTRQLVDLGLNIKNKSARNHIPDYVRLTNDPIDLELDSFEHNQHYHGNRHHQHHPRWEYSQECVDIINQYFVTFPEVFDFISTQDQRRDRNEGGGRIAKVMDLFPDAKSQQEAIEKTKQVAEWIESLPLSKLPNVDIGFQTIASDMITRLAEDQSKFHEHKESALDCKSIEWLPMKSVYSEIYPFWCGPDDFKNPNDFTVGDRVLNINSTGKFDCLNVFQRGNTFHSGCVVRLLGKLRTRLQCCSMRSIQVDLLFMGIVLLIKGRLSTLITCLISQSKNRLCLADIRKMLIAQKKNPHPHQA